MIFRPHIGLAFDIACWRMRRAALPLVVSTLVLTGAAAHALTPIAQERSVHGTQDHWIFNNSGQLVSEVHDSESFSAPDFGAFIAHTDGYHWPHAANDTASQVSAIQAERIHAEGRADATPATRFLQIHDTSGHGAVYPSDVCATSWASGLYAVDFRVRQVGEVPALPAPLVPLFGLALAGAARRQCRSI